MAVILSVTAKCVIVEPFLQVQAVSGPSGIADQFIDDLVVLYALRSSSEADEVALVGR